ncbi:MAG: L-fucose:H+ symporter permease [Cytophagales bacterium]|nr:L-fucose:H+ symporter permease [Bernardetiaceae bacterium]MDW8204634.1 L-fucose:H+ symporter permease [Cytophagales bacterium]
MKTSALPFALITSLFFMWGLANNMTDTLLAAFKKIMSMTDFQTSWIQIAFYGSYFCLALPAALLIKKFTYKFGVMVGLGLFIAGALLFYPASLTQQYSHFLIALFILAGGLSILETSANPFVIAMGLPETGTQRLNFAQSFNPIGSIIGVLLSKFFILSELNQATEAERAAMSAEQLAAIQSEELAAVMGPYVGVAVFLLFLLIAIGITPMPAASDEGGELQLGATFRRLLQRPRYFWGVVAQFFYVGAQIGVWSFTIRYVMQELQVNEQEASNYYVYSLVMFMISRFVCTFLMRFITPARLLTYMAILAMALTCGVIFLKGQAAVWCLVGISGSMSLMFPTIYGIALEGLGDDTKIGASGLIMAILGGAVLTAAQGMVSDQTGSIHIAYVVPLFCFLVVAWYGAVNVKRPIPQLS